MRRVWMGMAALTLCAVLAPTVAQARPSYQGVFRQNYQVKPDSNLAKAGCDLCHMGASKSMRNPYGADLAKALGKPNASAEDVVAGLKKIENSPGLDKKTKYVDLIKADKLPGK